MSAPRDATTYPPAELDRRFYAFAIDRLAAWSLYAGATYLVYVSLLEPGRTVAGVAALAGTVALVGLGAALLLGLAGTSPGKALVGMRVVGHTTGRPIGVGRALLRTLVLGAATLPTAGLGVATLAWTAVADPGRQRRGWHDHLSHAVVVDVRPAPEAVEVVEEVRPRQLVNLTAMRLVPAPAPRPPSVPTPRRTSRPAPPNALPAGSPAVAVPPVPPPAFPPAAPPVAPPPTARPVTVPPSSAPPTATAPRTPVPPGPPPPPTRVARPAPAPGSGSAAPRWRVSFDTGETFVVEGLALVGRRPEGRAGESARHLVALRSSDMSLSKTHAQFQVTPAGTLVVMDRGSTNGSVVVRQGVSKALTAGRPTTLLAGDVVRFGDRQMTVERA